MRQNRTIIFLAIVAGVLMTLFPPWQVSRWERVHNDEYGFGPNRPAGYAFIGDPPNVEGWLMQRRIARLDEERLVLQYITVLLLAGFTAIIKSWFVEKSKWWSRSRTWIKGKLSSVWTVFRGRRKSDSSRASDVGSTGPSNTAASRRKMNRGWYRIRPLSQEDSGRALLLLLTTAVLYASFSTLSLPTNTLRSVMIGVMVGNTVGFFGICSFAGWFVSAVSWILLRKSKLAATIGFYCGAFAVGGVTLAGLYQLQNDGASPLRDGLSGRLADAKDSWDQVPNIPTVARKHDIFDDLQPANATTNDSKGHHSSEPPPGYVLDEPNPQRDSQAKGKLIKPWSKDPVIKLHAVVAIPDDLQPINSIANSTDAPQSLPTVTMTIGDKPFVIQKALNEDQREKGLTYRDSMPADQGMIFAFAEEQPLNFWMKNTHIPLDIIFTDHEGRVVAIQQGKPLDVTDLPCNKPAKYVIELNLGGTANAGLKVGDVIKIPQEVAATDR